MQMLQLFLIVSVVLIFMMVIYAVGFKNNFKISDDCVYLKDSFLVCYEKHVEQHESAVDVVFTAEDVDCAIQSLKSNKAAGPDGLSSEHSLYAGGRLAVLLAKLLNSYFVHGFVSESFATPLTVPVLKGNASKLNVFEGYRPVSLINFTLKVFEMCLLNVLNRLTVNDELQ